MWLSKQLFPSLSSSPAFSQGKVTASRQGLLTVQGEEEYRQAHYLGPRGIFSVPLQGADALSLRLPEGTAYLGAFQKFPDTLQPGELLLQSAGGACILLKNDGTIVLNDTVIPAGKEGGHGYASV